MIVIRWLLGLFLLAMGANKFLGFMPAMDLPQEAGVFLTALADTGYMIPMIGITELTVGTLLLISATAPFAFVLLAPLSLNIILFHIFLAPDSMAPGATVFLLNVIFGAYYFDYYRSMFSRMMTEKVFYRKKTTQHTGKVTATAN